jgi:tetratricopeptide (TPR) repeat protein
MDALLHGRPADAEAATRAVMAAHPNGASTGEPYLTAAELHASSLDYLGQHARAAEEFAALIDATAPAYGDTDSRVIRYRLSCAAELGYLGQYEDAEDLFRAAVSQSAKLPPYQGQAVLRLAAISGLVGISNMRGAYADAESLARSAIGEIPRLAKWRSRFMVVFQIGIGSSLNGQQRYSEALLAVQGLRPVYVQDIVALLDALSTAHIGTGQFADAELVARNAVMTGEKGLSAAHYLTLQSGTLLGIALARQGKLDDAKSQLQANASAWLEHFGGQHPKAAAAQRVLAHVQSVA